MKTKVVTNEPPINREILAESINTLAKEIQRLDKSGLNRKAIVILLQASTGLRRDDINLVLSAIAQLQRDYCK